MRLTGHVGFKLVALSEAIIDLKFDPGRYILFFRAQEDPRSLSIGIARPSDFKSCC